MQLIRALFTLILSLSIYHLQAKSLRPSISSSLQQYAGDLVLRFRIRSDVEAAALASACETLFVDVWQLNSEFGDVRLAKETIPLLLGLLPSSLQEAHTPLIHDLASLISETSALSVHENVPHASPASPAPEEANIFFRDYQPLSVIQAWLRLLSSLFPSHVRLISLGLSYQNREVQALRVGVRPSRATAQNRKTIVISGGSHAREWIGVSTVAYVAYHFITEYGRSRVITRLLEQFDFVFIPTTNPDGYVFTFEHDRLWKKTRQHTTLNFCKGLDLDRSFEYQWRQDTDNPCAESYGGGHPFEAVEAQLLADWARNQSNIVAFLDFHSYSQQVLYPYSFSCAQTPPTLENLEELAIGIAKAIRNTNGEVYGVTSSCEVTSPPKCAQVLPDSKRLLQGGSALDYFYHELNVSYSYQIKLRDQGAYGFLLPRDKIVPTGKEATNAVEYLAKFLAGDKGAEQQSILDDAKLSHPRDQDGFLESEWTQAKSHDEEVGNSPQVELRKRAQA